MNNSEKLIKEIRLVVIKVRYLKPIPVRNDDDDDGQPPLQDVRTTSFDAADEIIAIVTRRL